jgi:RNase P/RNase MRP subunit p29
MKPFQPWGRLGCRIRDIPSPPFDHVIAMRSTLPTLLLALSLTGVVSGVADAQLVGRNETVYTWRGTIPSGGQFTVRNFNGPIDIKPATGNTVEFRAEKRPRSGAEITDVAFEVRTSSNGDVSICSTMNEDSCEGDRRRSDGWHREVTVTMTVLVPRNLRLKVATGNGALNVDGAGSEVQASTGNGRVHIGETQGTVNVSTGNGDVEVRNAKARVHVSTGNGDVDVVTVDGPVEVSSGNGDIDVRMSALRAKEDMSFTTGSGDVKLTLPASYNGELDASTGNGTIRTDFDLKLKGQLNPRHIRATIGEGGPMLRMSTGNGEFQIRKG